MAQNKIRVRLKSYDSTIIDAAAAKVVDVAKRNGSKVSGPISLPATAEAYAVHAIDLIDSRIYIYNAEADKIGPGELSDRVMMLDGVNVWKPDVE